MISFGNQIISNTIGSNAWQSEKKDTKMSSLLMI